jgi:hypothetical protein
MHTTSGVRLPCHGNQRHVLFFLHMVVCCRSQPPGATIDLSNSVPSANSSSGRGWIPLKGWVTTPQVIIKGCTLVVPFSELYYWWVNGVGC